MFIQGQSPWLSTTLSAIVLSNRFSWEGPVYRVLHPAVPWNTISKYLPLLLTRDTIFWVDFFNLLDWWSLTAYLLGEVPLRRCWGIKSKHFKPCRAQPHAHDPAIARGGRKGQLHSEGGEKEMFARRGTVTLSVFLTWASAMKRLGTAAKDWMNFLFFAHSALLCGWADWIWSKQQEEDLPSEWKTALLRENKYYKNATNSYESGTFLSKILSLWKRQCSLCEPHYIQWHTST